MAQSLAKSIAHAVSASLTAEAPVVSVAAFQSPRANGAHDFEVGKIPVQPYVAFHSRTEPRWLIVLSCSFLLCLLLAPINSVNRVFVLQRTHALAYSHALVE